MEVPSCGCAMALNCQLQAGGPECDTGHAHRQERRCRLEAPRPPRPTALCMRKCGICAHAMQRRSPGPGQWHWRLLELSSGEYQQVEVWPYACISALYSRGLIPSCKTMHVFGNSCHSAHSRSSENFDLI